MSSTYKTIGGNNNRGEWDDGNGAIITVGQRADGVIRRQRRSYSGQGKDWTVYTKDARDQGGAFVPTGVKSYSSAAAAVRGR